MKDSPETACRELEVHREANSIAIALDNLGDEINSLEGQLSSVLRAEPPIPVGDSQDKIEGPSTQHAQTLNGYVGRLHQLRHNVQSIKTRLEV